MSSSLLRVVPSGDAGGSSRFIRETYKMQMPPIGDVRSGLAAFALSSSSYDKETMRFFMHRLRDHAARKDLDDFKHANDYLRQNGNHSNAILLNYLNAFDTFLQMRYALTNAPFDYHSAAIGNLILVGMLARENAICTDGSLNGDLAVAAINHLSTLIRAPGIVLPVTPQGLFAHAVTEDGIVINDEASITERKLFDDQYHQVLNGGGETKTCAGGI